MEAFTFTGIILAEGGEFAALCPELDVATQGDSPEEAKTLLLEAAELYLESAYENGVPYLRPIPPGADPRQVASERIVELFHFRVDLTVRAHA